MPLLLSQCLVAYTFLQYSLFLFFNKPSSLFLLHKSPQSSQNSSSASFSVSLMETIMVFFFLGSKTLAEHCIVTVQWLLLSSSFLFFFFVKKNFAEALIAEKKILPETIQNIDASSTFDRMLWLKLQQW